MGFEIAGLHAQVAGAGVDQQFILGAQHGGANQPFRACLAGGGGNFVQLHALAAGELGQRAQGKHQQVALIGDRRDLVGDRLDERCGRQRGSVLGDAEAGFVGLVMCT